MMQDHVIAAAGSAAAKPQSPKRPQLNIADPDNELRDMIDDLRSRERPVPSQSEIVRRIVREAWERQAGKGKPKGGK